MKQQEFSHYISIHSLKKKDSVAAEILNDSVVVVHDCTVYGTNPIATEIHIPPISDALMLSTSTESNEPISEGISDQILINNILPIPKGTQAVNTRKTVQSNMPRF